MCALERSCRECVGFMVLEDVHGGKNTATTAGAQQRQQQQHCMVKMLDAWWRVLMRSAMRECGCVIVRIGMVDIKYTAHTLHTVCGDA